MRFHKVTLIQKSQLRNIFQYELEVPVVPSDFVNFNSKTDLRPEELQTILV